MINKDSHTKVCYEIFWKPSTKINVKIHILKSKNRLKCNFFREMKTRRLWTYIFKILEENNE